MARHPPVAVGRTCGVLGRVSGAIQAEITEAAREVARLVAPALEERLADRYGPHWLNAINQERRAAGAGPGRGLHDHRFCLAVYGHDPATEGWVDESLRRGARDLNTLANKAAHDDRLTPRDLDSARDIAKRFGQHYAGRRPETGLRPPSPARQLGPPTIHVHELAQELGLSNKACHDLILELGIGPPDLTQSQADRVRRRADVIRRRGQGPPVPVADLARELGMTNEECIELCQAMRWEVTSPSSLVSGSHADKARQTARELRFGRYSPRRTPNVEETPRRTPNVEEAPEVTSSSRVSAAPADRVREWAHKLRFGRYSSRRTPRV